MDGTRNGEYGIAVFAENDVMNQSSALENAPEAYEEPEGSSIDVIPQKVLMQFISELPAGYRTVFNLYILKRNPIRRLLDYWELMKILCLAVDAC